MIKSITDVEQMAKDEWDNAALGDKRLNKRAVNIGIGFFKNPFASPPQVFKTHKELKGFYRFIENEKINHDALLTSHCEKSRKDMENNEQVLAIHDFSTVTLNREYNVEGAYDIGNIQGFVVMNSISVIPHETHATIEGLLNQIIVKRVPKEIRKKEDVESKYWKQSVEKITSTNHNIIDVMDRGGDAIEIMQFILDQDHNFLIRGRFDRNIVNKDYDSLFKFARAIPTTERFELIVNKDNIKKEINLSVGFSKITLDKPKNRSDLKPIECTAVHTIQTNVTEGEEPLEWILLTSLKVDSFEDAKRIIRYYSFRWIIEEYHKCLKTGFRLEKSQFETANRVENLLAFISVISIKLLQLREISKISPDEDAENHIPKEEVDIVRHLYSIRGKITVDKFLRCIAGWGGFLNRKSDGHPGWQTLWLGWKYFIILKEGISYGKRIGEKRCG